MTAFYMYTVYTDLLMETENMEAKMEETNKKQKMRDQLVHKKLINLNIQFPLQEDEFEKHFHFFVEESLTIKMINFLFIKKDQQQVEMEYIVVSNGLQKTYKTKKEAFNDITKSTGAVIFYNQRVEWERRKKEKKKIN